MLKLIDDFEIVVIANKRKRCLTVEHLKDIPHRVCFTADYALPSNIPFTDDWVNTPKVFLGAYRCFRGHQDALKTTTKETVLVLEDDAVPKDSNWMTTTILSIPLLSRFEIVSLHSRMFRLNICSSLGHNGIEFLVPDRNNLLERGKDLGLHDDKFFCTGSLAYLVNRKSIPKIIEHQFNGVPMDIYLWKEFPFCFIRNTPFIHDRSQGSLVEDDK